MKERRTENPQLAARLRDQYRSLSEFYEKHFQKDNVMAFDTVRRAIYEGYPVAAPTLILIMDALGFSRAEIADALEERGDARYARLIAPAGGIEGDFSLAERQIVDEFRELKTGNPRLHTALTAFLQSVSGLTSSMLADPGNTPLHVLAGAHLGDSTRKEFAKALRELLKVKGKKPDINATNAHGATPLIYACMAGNEEIAVLLIERGADVEVRDADDMTAIHYADRLRLVTVLELLKKKHPDVVLEYFIAK